MYCCVLVTKCGPTQLELTPTTVKKFLNATHECRWAAVNELVTAGVLLQKAAVTEEQRSRLTTDKPKRDSHFCCKTVLLMSYRSALLL
jgi:hypothetical protein